VTTSIFSRRRAERFAQMLEEADGSPRHHARTRLDGELASLATIGRTATALRPAFEHDPMFRPAPSFRAELRAMLIATAEREGIGVSAGNPAGDTSATVRLSRPLTRHAKAPRRGRYASSEPAPSLATDGDHPVRRRAATLIHRPGRRAVVIGVLAATMAVSGVAAASGGAMPGDPLYGVKRSTERAQLALAGSDVTRGQIYLSLARTRMAEAGTVYRDAGGFSAALNDMDGDTRQGVRLLTTAAADRRDPAALDAIDGFLTDQQRAVGGLLDKVNGNARTKVLGSLELLNQVGKRSAAMRTALSCGTPTGGGSDALGPKPRQCSAAAGSGGVSSSDKSPAGSGSSASHSPKTDPTAGPGAKASPSGATASTPAEQTGQSGQPTQSQSPSPAPSDNGGLLNELGRLVGGILGG
jgi:hypothetical protein